MDKLKIIKTTVFILTFLLIVGTLCVLGLLAMDKKQTSNITNQQFSLSEPQGSIIKGFSHDGSNLFIHVIGGGQNDRIIIFNRTDGKKLATIKLN